VAAGLTLAPNLRAETGHDLWLRYPLVTDSVMRVSYRQAAAALVLPPSSPTSDVIAAELTRGLRGLLGSDVPRVRRPGSDGAVIVGTPSTSPAIAALGWADTLARLGDEGYVIRSTKVGGHATTVIASAGEAGALYGTFHFLRLIQTKQPLARLDITERPRLERRLLNHWDNLDGSIERGYAGRSLWWPSRDDQRIRDYARANASIGINGAVINSVNANPQSLSAPLLQNAADIARVLRPYRIRVYLAANFAAPKMLGDLTTNDPLDPAVITWWRAKADEIYRLIPDFGGFVVKANSEGQPGPQDYGRTHADGANVLADALEPHDGIVMWRAFVYDETVDRDRVKRAYSEFVPLDGRFRKNVFAQVKNGPLDFQPREPFHPIFGAMPKTPLMAELQITQEYLGQSNHLVYLAPMWKELLDADTFAQGAGSTVEKIVDGSLEGKRRTGIAGVANTGRDENWTGHDFAQANWYAFGRLAWDPSLSAGAIAEEWIRMTWGSAPDLVATIRSIMLDSREAFVRYTMPLGLHHLIGGDHYAPMPENVDPRRSDWSATVYHQADASGIGYDRTPRGSGAVDQYRSPIRERWSDPATTPDALLLWFHRLPWDYRMKSGRTLWAELVASYRRGADEARGLETRWTGLRGKVDDERYEAVLAKLRLQSADAAAWRDKCLRYFQSFSHGSLSEVLDPGPDANGNPRRLAIKTGHVSNYDEAKVPPYTLPDPLVSFDKTSVRDAQTWVTRRRPEIVHAYETQMFGRVPASAPRVTWRVTETNPRARDGAAVSKRIVGTIGDGANAPAINVMLYTPAHASRSVPVILVVNFGGGGAAASPNPAGPIPLGDPPVAAEIIARGWGYATVGYQDIQPDHADGWADGVIGVTQGSRGGKPAADEWGTISAWAWGASRIVDYLEKDASIDPAQIALFGHSRLGKTALWASALDTRIAAVYSSCAGEMGSALARRDFGETVDDMAQNFSWQFAGNFQQWAGRWNEMPVDAHMLIALSAPRPVFITGGSADQWADPVGEFLAEVAAGPVYRLLGRKDLGVTTLPPLDTALTSGDLGWRYHTGGHAATQEDWSAFLQFLGKYFTAR